MLAGNRQHVGQAGNIHGVVERLGDGVTLAGDQRRGDRARVSRNRGTDTPVDSVAHALDDGRVAEPEARTARRGGDLDLADRQAGRTESLTLAIAGRGV